jgi:hypothetical protein
MVVGSPRKEGERTLGGGAERSAGDVEVVWSLQSYQERAVLGGGEVMGGILGKVRRKPDSKAGWGKLRLRVNKQTWAAVAMSRMPLFHYIFQETKTNQSDQTSYLLSV